MPTQAGPQPPKEDRDPNKINDHLKVRFFFYNNSYNNNKIIPVISRLKIEIYIPSVVFFWSKNDVLFVFSVQGGLNVVCGGC